MDTPYTRATIAAVPFLAAQIAGLTPGAVMAPNFVYNAVGPDGRVTQEVTERYTETAAPACFMKSNQCVDAVTHGLLSGLTPILSTNESVLNW